MKLTQFPLLTDENIHPAVVQFLRHEQFDVLDVAEDRLFGTTDADLLRMASTQGRVIVTHDSDFGTLAIFQGEPVIGIIYIRPAVHYQYIANTVRDIAGDPASVSNRRTSPGDNRLDPCPPTGFSSMMTISDS